MNPENIVWPPDFLSLSRAMRTALVGLGLTALAVVLCGCSAPAPSTASQSGPIAPPPASWAYTDNKDAMRGSTTHIAVLKSSNTFADENRYRPAIPVELVIHTLGKRHQISIENSNLQFTCHGMGETYVQVKFDDGPVHGYRCAEASTSTYGIAFVSNEPRFIAALRKAKHLTIEADVFQRGAVQMNWDVPPLWASGPPA